MKRLTLLASLALLAALSAGCFEFERKSTTGPSSGGAAALLGSWTSGSIVPQPGQCSDFKWDVTEQTGNSAAGSFSATCAGDLRISGTARGTLSGSTVTWSADAVASVPGLASCPITLNGTAELLVDSIRIPYAGTTCLGPVSGVETLKKR